jgi:hypothetical protein
MKLRTVSLISTQVLVLLCINTFLAKPTLSSRPITQQVSQLSEAELTERFNKTLDKELSGANVCVATSAARKLAELMKTSATKIVQAKALGRVGEAEKNIQTFAERLIEDGTEAPGRIRITLDGIERTLSGKPPIRVDPSEGDDLCPLFPIC